MKRLSCRLKGVLNFAYKIVPYYRRTFKRLQFNPDEVKDVEDIKSLPLLTKELINKNPESFVSEEYSKRNMMRASTSGTTGAGLIFWLTDEADTMIRSM